MTRILVVEDDGRIAQIARDYLERAGFEVEVAANGARALASAREGQPALIVLDLGLPAMDGLAVAATLRRESDVPIIMLTARVDEADRLQGLEVGADDYVTKPFSPRELVARVRAVLRRVEKHDAAGQVLQRGALAIDVNRLSIQRGGRVFTRSQLLDAVRGEEVGAFDRAIDTHIKNIRRKLEADPHHPEYVLTVYGAGYKFGDV
jgi:two-component system alkaline phosphatase synthesis response regulator PhoP